MDNVIEFPDVLEIYVHNNIIDKVRRLCGGDPKRVSEFVADAILTKLHQSEDDGEDVETVKVPRCL